MGTKVQPWMGTDPYKDAVVFGDYLSEYRAKDVAALTMKGKIWKSVLVSSLYDMPAKGGITSPEFQTDAITFSFKHSAYSTMIAERIIKYEGKEYSEKFIGAMGLKGTLVLKSLSDSELLIGEFDRVYGRLTFLFADDADSSFGSNKAVGFSYFKSYDNLDKSLRASTGRSALP